ncbi:MAG TPA: riboflavin kinase [Candidatus Pullichristensenella stercoripullorum]|nr:riboflavin kinase [Candidatus Pullichristensenella stercoripullorum]
MQITGVVAAGKRIGRTLGFPTANILPDEGCALPSQNGVYAALLTLADGRALPCVLNKGRHPTLPEGAATVEAFVLDFTGDLYGQRVRVDFLAFLRPETRFPDKEALRAQIARDTENARAWFAAHPH